MNQSPMKSLIGILLALILSSNISCASPEIEGLMYERNPNSENGKERIIWLLRKMNGKDINQPKTAHLTLGKDSVGAYSGCNSGSGEASISKGTIRIKNMSTTEMACSPFSILDFEQSYFDALRDVSSYHLQGNSLILRGKNSTLEFQKRVKPKASPLIGTKWNATAITEEEMVRSLFRDTKIVIELSKDRITGDFGCGKFEGVANQEDRQLRFTKIVPQINECKDPANLSQIQDFLARLPQVSSFRIDENRLVTYDDDKNSLFEFVAE